MSDAVMGGTHVIVHPDESLLAQAVATRLIARLAEVQASKASASLVLAGGGVAVASLAALARSPARDAVDWTAVDVWWSDERYLPTGDPERNETQARHALLDALPLQPSRVHPMPAAETENARPLSVDDAALGYRVELARHAAAGQELPAFDVLLLGVGPEGHTASIFPESPAVYEQGPVVAVHDCPKPPPERITLTLPAIRSAAEVWLLAAGKAKAAAIGAALRGTDEAGVPAAGARGRTRTLWLLDEAAAAEVPGELRAPLLLPTLIEKSIIPNTAVGARQFHSRS